MTMTDDDILNAADQFTGDAAAGNVVELPRNGGIETHDGYAVDLLRNYAAIDGAAPIAADGQLYRYSRSDGVWIGTDPEIVRTDVAKRYDGGRRCCTVNDYRCIVDQILVRSPGQERFDNAPVGIVTTDGFTTIDADGSISTAPCAPEQYQRFKLEVSPSGEAMPLWTAHLNRVFADDMAQAELLQEIFGAVVFRLMWRHEKVAKFLGLGQTGKSKTLDILQALVPKRHQCATSPFRWEGEYYVAALAGKWLNVVGELPEDKPLPSAPFKQVTGRDLVQGRHPTHRPFEFRCTAAHLFNSNHLINTRDRSSAFFRRWLILEFRNVIPDGEVDEGFADKVIERELPQILQWAIDGAARVLRQGFTQTDTHQRALKRWQVENNSVLSWLLAGDDVELESGRRVLRSVLFPLYKQWCLDEERSPLGKRNFIKELANPVVMKETGIAQRLIDGQDWIFGIRMRH